MRLWLGVGLLAGFVMATGAASAADRVRTDHVEARLVADVAAIKPGQAFTLALEQKIIPGWHTYWQNPGDSGEPTNIAWALPEGFVAGPLQWPAPKRIEIPPLVNFGYEDEAILLAEIRAPETLDPEQVVTLAAHVSWLVCEDICIPEEGDVSLRLPVAMGDAPPSGAERDLFERARSKIPVPLPAKAQFAVEGERLTLALAEPGIAAAARRAELYPVEEGVIRNAARQRLSRRGDLLLLTTEAGRLLTGDDSAEPRSSFDAVLVVEGRDRMRAAFSLSAEAGPVGLKGGGLSIAQALVFALLGGLILNLMPCVFPVLSMKALALATFAGKEARAARHHGFAYGGGVVLSFLAIAGALLALRSTGELLGWGFQLQSPLFVTALFLLFLAIGLNLAGVYEVSVAQSLGATWRSDGLLGAGLTGVLAAVVASPCTVPFMAAALGAALVAPPAVALAIFAALGLGMALPFVALSASPRLISYLPRPGEWMVRFRQLMAFPMFGAAGWLLWVLSAQVGRSGLALALAAALALGFAAWALGVGQHGNWRRQWPRLAALAGLVAVAAALLALPSLSVPARPSAEAQAFGLNAEPYSAARLAALREAGEPVFVNITADWCITCKVNEAVALSTPRVAQAFAERGVRYLKGDWTTRDPEITKLLEAYGRSGVPLYLYFAPGAERAKIMPQLLTEDIVLAALAVTTAELEGN
jgi:thiol:disulfide interchange protein DsbD